MKQILIALLLICITYVNAAEKKYGKAITIKEKTPVSTILLSPDKFEGKTVLVEGKILGVCQEQGCWIEVAGANKNEKIKIKVKDGEIVFPKNSKGKTALVEGVVAEVKEGECSETEMKDKKDGAGCSMNATKDAKASVDKKESGCCPGEETAKVYQIEGLGAEIR